MDFILIDPQDPVESVCALYLEPQGTKIVYDSSDEIKAGQNLLVMHPCDLPETGPKVSHLCHGSTDRLEWHVKNIGRGWLAYSDNPLEFLQKEYPYEHPQITLLAKVSRGELADLV